MYLKALILFYINNKILNSHVKLIFYTIIIRSNVVKVTMLLDSNKKSLNSKNLIVLDLIMLGSSNNKPLNARLEQRYALNCSSSI